MSKNNEIWCPWKQKRYSISNLITQIHRKLNKHKYPSSAYDLQVFYYSVRLQYVDTGH
jgi:hypothetical protein